MSYRLNRRRDLKSAKIGAPENITCVWWSGDKSYMNGNRSVETDSVSFDCSAEGGLFDQSRNNSFR
jgi:hypothetical protein